MATREKLRKRKCERKLVSQDGATNLSMESELLRLVSDGNVMELLDKVKLMPKKHKDITDAFLKSAELGHKRVFQIFVEIGVNINAQNVLGNTALHIASQHGFIDLVKLLVRNSVLINCQNQKGETALMLGLRRACSLPLIEYLISDETGANVNIQNFHGKTALMIAIEQQDFCTMKLLMSHKDIKLELKDQNGKTAFDIAKDLGIEEIFCTFKACSRRSDNPLFLAIKKNSVPLVRSVLYTQSLEEVNSLDDGGFSPLMVSLKVKSLNIDIIRMLLKSGAHVNMGSANSNLTPLFLACKTGSMEAVELLVKEGADVNSQSTFEKLTPLMCACQNNKIEIAKFLIKNKANINSKSRNNKTALMLALKSWNKTCVEHLIKNGAEINDAVFQLAVKVKLYKLLPNVNLIISKDVLNETFLFACEQNDLKLARFLLENGAEVNHIDEETIPLVKTLDNIELVNLLISFGADVNLKNTFGTCPLIEAVYLDDGQVMETLIKQGADLNTVNSIGYTALMIAAKEEKLPAMNLLLDCGADVNYMSVETGHLSALNAALNSDKTKSVKLLLSRGATVHQTTNSPLLQSLNGDDKNMELCLKHGADPNARFDDGSTVLMLALKTRSDYSKVKLLLDFGADTTMKNDNGESALILAAKYCTTMVIDLLLKSGADVNAEDNYGSSVLLCAVAHSVANESKIALLLSSGAELNTRNHSGDTPLIMAAKCCHVIIMQLLVAKGANVNVQDQNGFTPLMHTVSLGHYDKLKFLIDCNANLEIQSKSGTTALILATWEQLYLHKSVTDQCFIIRLLLDKGANVNAKDQRGFTPLMHAVIARNWKKVILLIQYNADLNTRSNDGTTAVLIASAMGSAAILKILLDEGASVNIDNDNGNSALSVLLPHLYSWLPHTLPDDKLLCFKLLLAAGAKLDMQNPKNALLFHKLIVYYDDPEIIDLFMKTGAAPTVISFAALRSICTLPTYCTAFSDNIEIVSPLLTAMLSKNIKLASGFLKCWYLHKIDIDLSQNKSLHSKIYKENALLLNGVVASVPFSLTCLSFMVVSTAVGNGLDRESRVSSLPIPAVMKDSLLFRLHKPFLPDNEVRHYSQRVDFQNYTQEGLAGLDMVD